MMIYDLTHQDSTYRPQFGPLQAHCPRLAGMWRFRGIQSMWANKGKDLDLNLDTKFRPHSQTEIFAPLTSRKVMEDLNHNVAETKLSL